MTYEQTLAYLYDLLPMYQRQGKTAFKKDLSNIRELCFRMNFPQWQFNSIHIAGTNGKGSVSAMLASILKEAGYKTGLYTSPHLKEFTERIRVNGKEMSKKDVVSFVEEYKETIEEVNPSFFELTVAMAFKMFADKQVDLAVVEVGLGGRLDSTNIITPEVGVITNISFDHQDLLGNTLEEIAREKAGIIKKYTPIIIGEYKKETQPIFEEVAESVNAPITCASKEVDVIVKKKGLYEQTFEIKGQIEEEFQTTYQLGLGGTYQAQNLATCISTVNQLVKDGWDIPLKAVKRGLKKVSKNTGFAGRMQVLESEPITVCDTAHNEAGIKAVLEQLSELPHKELHIVWGMVNDKDHGEILNLLPQNAQYYFAKPNIPRGLDASDLHKKAQDFNLKGTTFDSVSKALEQAKVNAKKEDMIFVGGSTFVVAEVV